METLAEATKDDAPVAATDNPDANMVLLRKRHVGIDGSRSEKLQQFVARKNEAYQKQVLLHNLSLVEMQTETENIGDVIDSRIDKQVERTINESLRRVKKGSKAYLNREKAD